MGNSFDSRFFNSLVDLGYMGTKYQLDGLNDEGRNDLLNFYFAQKQARDEAQKNREFQSSEADKDRAFNSEEAQKQRDFQEEMWNKTNEYNSPTAERERLTAAGYNPLWLEGSQAAADTPSGAAASFNGVPSGGVGVGPSAPSMAGYSGARAQMIAAVTGGVEKLVESGLKPALAMSGMDLNRAQSVLALTNAETNMRGMPFVAPQARANVAKTMADTALQKALESQAKEMQHNFELDATWKSVRNEWSQKTFDAAYREALSRLQENDAKAVEAYARAGLDAAQTDLASAQTDVANAAVGKTKAETQTEYAKQKLIAEQTTAQQNENQILAVKSTLVQYGLKEDDPLLFKCIALVQSGELGSEQLYRTISSISQAYNMSGKEFYKNGQLALWYQLFGENSDVLEKQGKLLVEQAEKAKWDKYSNAVNAGSNAAVAATKVADTVNKILTPDGRIRSIIESLPGGGTAEKDFIYMGE